jgi:hypothetical protein
MQSLERRFESTSVKAVVITILTVLMLWPLSRVESLISERQNLQHEAYADGTIQVRCDGSFAGVGCRHSDSSADAVAHDMESKRVTCGPGEGLSNRN